MRASFRTQLRALLWRNFLLKVRNGSELVPEVLFPILCAILLVAVKYAVQPESRPTTTFPVKSLSNYSINTSRPILVVASFSVQPIMKKISTRLGNVTYYNFATLRAAEEKYRVLKGKVSAGIVFYNNPVGSNGTHGMHYAIRMPHNLSASTSVEFTDHDRSCTEDDASSCEADLYLVSGHAFLQTVIDGVLIEMMTNRTLPDTKVSAQVMAVDGYTPGLNTIAPFYFMFAYAFFINCLTVNLVAEKEKKLREGMFMVGLRNSIYWSSWFIVYFVIILLVTTVMTLITAIAELFPNSNIFLLFVLLMMYGLSIVALAFLLTTFFDKAHIAGAMTCFPTIFIAVLYLATGQRHSHMWESIRIKGFAHLSTRSIWILCLFSPLTMAFAMERFVHSDRHYGWNSQNVDIEFPFSAHLIMLLVDIVLYVLLAMYLDHVLPKKYGPNYAPWYFLQPSFWCPRTSTGEDETEADDNDQHLGPNIEPVSTQIKSRRVIRISNLTKIYHGKLAIFRRIFNCLIPCCATSYGLDVTGVRKLSLDLYEGEITALLGHNGAGKTTIINLLTGLTRPTSGTAKLHGFNLFSGEDMEKVRPMCGICLQFQNLYPELTAFEHLQLIAGMKGLPHDRINGEVTKLLGDVGLTDHAHVRTSVLTGGQKRKLAVAIALIGDPKIIFLDEPTTGMDAFSRRYLWSLLRSCKEGRVILLTTHFMDEADILADRKAIISKGKLQCVGSSLFLKKRFGMGYNLNMVVDVNCVQSAVSAFLAMYIKEIQEPRAHGKELAYTLPLTEMENFVSLFKALEQVDDEGETAAESLGILSYSVSMPTLEEVFLKLGTVRYVCTEEEDTAEPPVHSPSRRRFTPVYSLDPAGTSVDQPAKALKHRLNPILSAPTRHMEVSADGSFTGIPNGAPDAELSEVTHTEVYPHVSVEHIPESSKRKLDPSFGRLTALLHLRLLMILHSRGTFVTLIILPMGLVTGVLLSPATDDAVIALKADAYVDPGSCSTWTILDSVNDSISRSFSNLLNTSYQVDRYTSANLSKIRLHLIGTRILATDSFSQMIQSYTILYNYVAIHALPAAINAISRTMLKQLGSPRTIAVSSLPWPSEGVKDGDNGFALGLMIGLAFTLTAPSFGIFVVGDKLYKCRNQLRVSGVSPHQYWGSTCLFGFVISLFPIFLFMLLTRSMDVKALTVPGAELALTLLFITSSQAYLLLVLLCCFGFDKPETAQAVIPNVLSMFGMASFMAMAMLDALSQEVRASLLHVIFVCVNPFYTIFGGVFYIHRVYRVAAKQGREPKLEDYFSLDSNVSICLIVNVLDMVLGYVVLVILDEYTNGGSVRAVFGLKARKSGEKRDINSAFTNKSEDEDIVEERRRVENLEALGSENDDTAVYGHQLTHVYKSKECMGCGADSSGSRLAVRNLSFAVRKGEVLGLLGPNGAGKTTTVKIMTGEIQPTHGKVVIIPPKFHLSIGRAATEVGYCPQADGLWEKLTLQEHLYFYAAIKGIRRRDRTKIVNYFVESLKLQKYRKMSVRNMSYGTRRKLSYAISMLGDPKIVLLDEPSTGMDPRSKRFFWDSINSSFQGTDRAAILTTHYMEEADALCSRVGILVNGMMGCLGTTNHLKKKYGGGYLLDLRLCASQESSKTAIATRMEKLEDYLLKTFPNARCLEKYGECAIYKIPSEHVVLSYAFEAMEKAKMYLNVEYGFSQATLEQVFISFARHQAELLSGENQRRQPSGAESSGHPLQTRTVSMTRSSVSQS